MRLASFELVFLASPMCLGGSFHEEIQKIVDGFERVSVFLRRTIICGIRKAVCFHMAPVALFKILGEIVLILPLRQIFLPDQKP